MQEDGFPGVWSVVKVERDGSVTYPRARWRGLSCIDAQVIVAELTRAHLDGLRDARRVLAESLGD